MTSRSEADALFRLDDYARGQLPDGEVDAFEDELFARALAGEAPELRFRHELGKTFREMDARGTTNLWLNRRQAEALYASGVRVIRFDLDPKALKVPDLSVDFDVLVTRVPLDLRGLEQLDVEITTAEGHLLKTMPEITFDPGDDAVYMCCEADLARAADTVKTVTRLWGTDKSGARRVLTTIAG